MAQKLYKVEAPIGTNVIPKEVMTEEELRNFFPQVVQDPEQAETWKEKAQKDEIDVLVDLLQTGGYIVEEVTK